MCCGVVVAASTIATALLLGHLVATVITDPGTRTLAHWCAELWMLLAAWTVRAVAHWLQGRLSQQGASAVIADLSGSVLRSVTALPPRRIAERRDSATVVVTRGIDGLRPYFTAYLPALFMAAILTPATVAVIALNDVESAVTVLITLPLIPIFMVLIGLVTADRSAAALQAMTVLQARLLDLVAGIPTLAALGRAAGSASNIADLSAAHRKSALATLRIAFLSAFVLELLATLSVALVAVGIGLRLVFGELSLSAGLTVLLLAPEVFWPLRRVGLEFHAAQDGKTAAAEAFTLIEESPPPPRGGRSVTAHGSEIRFDDVMVLGRDGAAPDALTATIAPGEVTVLTGVNGAGKSTALQVLLGLTGPDSGRVSVAGVDVADLDGAQWWAQVAWLPQRPVLIPGTVAENLELLAPVPDLGKACAASCFDQVLGELPGGLGTVLGRGGVGLSLGQRQRLGLTRALGSQAHLLLLDEPTAHLDADTEAHVLRAVVARARAGDTVVVVGHRALVLDIADHIVEVGARRHAVP
ncbi:MAG: thiol reductant ABC exporter subunit CydD [Mycobacterium sp.]